MDDSESNTCLICHCAWTVRLRRHHCRVCYRLVCSNCSDHFVELDPDGVSHRVCDECFPKLDIHLNLPCHSEGGIALHSVAEHESLFKIVVHHTQGMFPQSSIRPTEEGPDLPDLPTRHVYCVVSTAGKNILKTTKTKPCDPQLEYRATFEEPIVVKADLSKVFESYLVFQLHDRGGNVIGKCRASLGDIADTAPFSTSLTRAKSAVLLCKDLPLNSFREQCCLPILTYSITRMNTQGSSAQDQAVAALPDLPMYDTEVPYATNFSQFTAAIR
jgi:hypothetical protein